MEIFGVGPMEFIYLLAILLVVFGPDGLGKGARTVGSFVNQWRRSDDFQLVKQVAKEVRDLPKRLLEEAELNDSEKLKTEKIAEKDTPANIMVQPVVLLDEEPSI